MIEASAVEVKRDKYGMFFHPAFPWNDVGENDVRPFVKEWGYEAAFRSLEDDAPTEIQERYFNSNDPDCSYWTPNPPHGDGWFLGAIFDTEDGPESLWMRPITQHHIAGQDK
jgi:hypothetical protein